jgi:hypothetical protein
LRPDKTKRGYSSKKGGKAAATIAFVDESGFHLLPAMVHTWARKGKMLIPRHKMPRYYLPAIRALAQNGTKNIENRKARQCRIHDRASQKKTIDVQWYYA